MSSCERMDKKIIYTLKEPPKLEFVSKHTRGYIPPPPLRPRMDKLMWSPQRVAYDEAKIP